MSSSSDGPVRKSTVAGARRRSSTKVLRTPPGAWHACESLWGEAQRVRLVTGPPSLVDEWDRVRSIHAVAFTPKGEHLLLVENGDGSWTFPGGRLEGGENTDAALVREVWEEARAILAPDYVPIAATRIEFLNRVPNRIYRFHPTFLVWVGATLLSLSEEPCHDPAPNGVVGRRLSTLDEARAVLAPLEMRVLEAALADRGIVEP